MIKLAILGSTGSIGKTAIKVVKNHPELFQVVFLANKENKNELLIQAKTLNVRSFFCGIGISVKNGVEEKFDEKLLSYPETYKEADIVLNGIGGLDGLKPTVAALYAKKIMATANKESIVCAGNYINKISDNLNGSLRPIDSEHSTIWQCLGEKHNVKRIILTASGGAFRDLSLDALKNAQAIDALKHPNWIMGKKITVDCATLMNKGLEIIEAKRLFGINDVEAVIHRESIIHSLVEMNDGTMIAGLSNPDMEIPIQYALTYPIRKETGVKRLDLLSLGKLTFSQIDEKRFPCFGICKKVSDYGDYAGTVLNSSNEIAVEKYLKNELDFYGISDCIENALQKFGLTGTIDSTEEVFRIHSDVKEYTLKSIGGR